MLQCLLRGWAFHRVSNLMGNKLPYQHTHPQGWRTISLNPEPRSQVSFSVRMRVGDRIAAWCRQVQLLPKLMGVGPTSPPLMSRVLRLCLTKQCSHYEQVRNGFVLFILSVWFRLLMIFNWKPFTKERLPAQAVQLEICLSKWPWKI